MFRYFHYLMDTVADLNKFTRMFPHNRTYNILNLKRYLWQIRFLNSKICEYSRQNFSDLNTSRIMIMRFTRDFLYPINVEILVGYHHISSAWLYQFTSLFVRWNLSCCAHVDWYDSGSKICRPEKENIRFLRKVYFIFQRSHLEIKEI